MPLRIVIGLLALAAWSPAAPPLRSDAERAEIIQRLQREVAEKGYTFTVGDNPAMAYPLSVLCGALPEEFPQADIDADTRARLVADLAKSLPVAFDWRELEGVTPVKNQGGCGSCWAFAAMGVLESQIYIHDGVVVDLSEQYLVDCDDTSYGCQGGWTSSALMFMVSFIPGRGAPLEAWYPYRAADMTCTGALLAKPYKTTQLRTPTFNVRELIQQAIFEFGPVACSVAVDDLFQAYESGVFNAMGAFQTNHAVMLVGWNDEGGYWIMKNSWGPGWGEAGYMRIAYDAARIGTNTCWADYTPIAQPVLYQTQVVIDPAGKALAGDGRLDPGETAPIRLTVTNAGTPATNVQVEISCANPHITIDNGLVLYPDLATGEAAAGGSDFVISVSPDAPPGERLEFGLTFSATELPPARGRFQSRVSKTPVLILDLDGNGNSAPAIAAALTGLGVPVTLTQTPDWADLAGHEALFVCLGMSPNASPLTRAHGVALRNVMAFGTALYLEGGDYWTTSAADDLLRPWFQIEGVNPGAGDLGTVVGEPDTPWAGLRLTYTGDNTGVDRLAPVGGARLLARNEDPEYGCAVANHEFDFYGSGNPFQIRTIGASFEFGGVDGESARTELMRRILRVFRVPSAQAGDLNQDWVVDAADVRMLAECLAERAPVPDGVDLDIDGNGKVDVADLVALARQVGADR